MVTPADTRPGAIYARVSDEDKPEDAPSLDVQENSCAAAALRRGVPVPPEYRFRDQQSAKDNDRPGFRRLLDLILSGKVREVTAYNTFRFSRSIFHSVELVSACAMGKCRLYILDREVDLQNPEGAMAWNVEIVVGEWQRKRISLDVRNAQREMLRQDRWPAGKPPPGYRHLGSGRLEVDPDRAATLLEIARRFVSGELASWIARDLNARGIHGHLGGRWSARTVKSTIAHPCHLGIFAWNGHVQAWPYPRVLPYDLATAVHERIARNAVSHGPNRIRHPFAGLCRCGLCGGRMALHTSVLNAAGVSMRYLRCTDAVRHLSVPGHSPCRLKGIRITLMDALESEILSRVASAEAAPAAPETPAISDQLHAIEESRRRNRVVYEAGQKSDAEFQARLKELEALEQKILPSVRAPLPPSRLLDAIAKWDEAPMPEKNETMKLLVEAVLVYPESVLCRLRDNQWRHWPRALQALRPDGPWIADPPA